MKLTILGNYGTFPAACGACSGYLVRNGSANVLIDCGNGVMSRVQNYCRIEDIDAIVLTHLHLDHMADIFVFKYAMETKIHKGQAIARKKILLPATPGEMVRELYENDLFEMINITEDLKVDIGGMRFSFSGMPHLIESYAVTVMQGDKKLVYSGDMGRNEKIRKTVQGADLFLCESTLLEDGDECRLDHHFSAGLAGRIAAECDVKKLLLTHFWFEEDKRKYLEEARKYFHNTYLAEEFSTYD